MKRIKIGLSTASIANAVKKLEQVRNTLLPKMANELLRECCEQIIYLADQNLEKSMRGDEVIDSIKSSWEIVLATNGHAQIINHSTKAVYVEFGVGVVGSGTPHPSAAMAGYEYNKPSLKKDLYDSWYFYLDGEEALDIPLTDVKWSAYLDPSKSRGSTSNMIFYTSGAKGDMFLYNALEDFRISGKVYTIWKSIKEKYLV
jgi:hypothetical protein